MIRVSEIFGPTVQGEGALIGQPTVFVRTGGCDYRCSWCDTLHAVESKYREDWLPMSSEDIFEEVKKLSNDKPLVVTLSGGNPATQPLGELIDRGQQEGYRFAMETQGSVVHDWFSKLDVLTLSPKPPSSGMETDWDKLDQAVSVTGTQTQIALKIVIFDDQDYEYARHVSARYPDIPTYIQPGNHTPPDGDEEDGEIDIDGIIDRYDYLVNKIAEDQWFNVTLLPQLHVLVWGNKRGV
ncbi:7-carboxy-7-deazaguanine synthase QueE [Curvivirga sp.]|uniref:7-carboxy-7-deazaguanine synthase QueE n=1 Tax=Curvivirga sp. TaxID=2856848 RepID=UPI003B5BCA55